MKYIDMVIAYIYNLYIAYTYNFYFLEKTFKILCKNYSLIFVHNNLLNSLNLLPRYLVYKT